MICRGQRCQSARHKHGDYLIMKAVCCCSPGCELPARRRHREHRLWDAGKGWAPATHVPWGQRRQTGQEGTAVSPTGCGSLPAGQGSWTKGCRKPQLLQHCTWRTTPLLPRPPELHHPVLLLHASTSHTAHEGSFAAARPPLGIHQIPGWSWVLSAETPIKAPPSSDPGCCERHRGEASKPHQTTATGVEGAKRDHPCHFLAALICI